MFFSVFFCTVRLSIFERFVFASFEPLRFCKKVRFVFPDLEKSDSFNCYRIFLFDRKVSACRGLSPSRSDCFLLAERGMSESWPR